MVVDDGGRLLGVDGQQGEQVFQNGFLDGALFIRRRIVSGHRILGFEKYFLDEDEALESTLEKLFSSSSSLTVSSNKPFVSSLMFASKARACPSGAPYGVSISLLVSQISDLSKKKLASVTTIDIIFRFLWSQLTILQSKL